MGQAAVETRQLVNYTGSNADLHGVWSVTNVRGDGLYNLRNAYKMELIRVRPISVTPIEVPRLSEQRALALRYLARHRGARLDTRVRNWLVAAGLAHMDQREWEDRPVLAVTVLGFELAAAIRHLY